MTPNPRPGAGPVATGTGDSFRTGRDTFVHQALLYQSDREFTMAVAGYLRAGLMVGDATVVIAAPAVADRVRGQLGEEAAAPIEFIDAAEWFAAPVHTMAGYYERTARDWWPHGRLRLLAEPVWDGRTPLEVREWLRHEAILNEALVGTPTDFLCAYDARVLPPEIIEGAARTHPELLAGGAVRPSELYTDPADFYARCDARPLPPPPLSAARRTFASGGLPGLRAFLTAEATRLDLPADGSLPFVLAVNEVATMIIRSGGGHGAVWVWSEDGELVCDVTDPEGQLTDRFLGHLPPRAHRHADAAMWAVRRLCHIVEIRSGESAGAGVGFRGVSAGTRIRMRLKLH